jgi:hypothetical protein
MGTRIILLGLLAACDHGPGTCELATAQGDPLACIEYGGAVAAGDARASCESGGGRWSDRGCDPGAAVARCDLLGSSTWYYPAYLDLLGATVDELRPRCTEAGGEFTELHGSQCPAGDPADGEPCDLSPAVRCMTGAQDCRLAQTCSCTAERVFACTEVDFEAGCAGIQNASCSIEGNPGCSIQSFSGQRDCVDGQWLESSSCPPGCPEEAAPAPGSPCALDAGEVCPYDDQVCECVSGVFSCSGVDIGTSWRVARTRPGP